MKEYAYFPGCSLEKIALSYHQSSMETTRALGVELKELEDWNCCGATAYFHVDELLAYTLCARNLAMAEKAKLLLLALFFSTVFVRDRSSGVTCYRNRINFFSTIKADTNPDTKRNACNASNASFVCQNPLNSVIMGWCGSSLTPVTGVLIPTPPMTYFSKKLTAF